MIVAALALAAFAIVFLPTFGKSLLRAAGWALVVDEPVAPADIIVVSIDSGGAGARSGRPRAKRHRQASWVFRDPPSGEDFEFIRRGLPYEDKAARQIRQLKSLGVTDIMEISKVDGTRSEGRALPQWADERHLR